MVKTKQKQLGAIPRNKNVTPSGYIDSSNSNKDLDLLGEDGWVIVKKQRVTILVPPLPAVKKFIQNLEPSQLQVMPREAASDQISPQIDLCSRRPSGDEREKSISLAPKKGISFARKAPAQDMPTLAEPPRVDLRMGAGDAVQVATSKIQKRFGVSDTSRAIKRPRVLLHCPSGFIDRGMLLNQRLRASNLERNLQKAGGLSKWLAMLGLDQFVQCRRKLASGEESIEMKTYGDLGYKCMGKIGGYLTEFLILMSQAGGSVAYLVFIGQNLSSIFHGYGLTLASAIFLLVPIEIVLSWVGSLSALAPFSIFADTCNALAMAVVVKENIQKVLGGEFSFRDRMIITSNLEGLSFAGGMAVFSFGGFGMTLALEASMKERSTFLNLLAKTFTGITLVYVLFGFSGYMAYGDNTKEIVTLNLPHNWWAVAVQVGLCLGLIFTFPIIVHPINEIVEGNLCKSTWFQKFQHNSDSSTRRIKKCAVFMSRATLVVCLAVLASCVPGFGIFASLVGSTLCALISFVLPATFHLILFGSSLHFWQGALDFFILSCGLIFAAYGTSKTVLGV